LKGATKRAWLEPGWEIAAGVPQANSLLPLEKSAHLDRSDALGVMRSSPRAIVIDVHFVFGEHFRGNAGAAIRVLARLPQSNPRSASDTLAPSPTMM
jgi:hypothetical protein